MKTFSLSMILVLILCLFPAAFAASPPFPTERVWVVFAAAPDKELLQELLPVATMVYQVKDVRKLKGTEFPPVAQGWTIIRLEDVSPPKLPASLSPRVVVFRGVTEAQHYTSEKERTELKRISRKEVGAGEGVEAVLIPIGKTREWWELPQDKRHEMFAGKQEIVGHTALAVPFGKAIYRKLYHSRYLDDLPYDFITYFEFEREKTEAFASLLANLRNPAMNPEWNYVRLEYEIRMKRIR